MKIYDAIIIGAGVIGLSLALELRKRGLDVLIVDKGEPGREASWAAGGMLADCGVEIPPLLLPLANASARMYPEFVHELEDESGQKIDLRSEGTLLFHESAAEPVGHDSRPQAHTKSRAVTSAELAECEPAFSAMNAFMHQHVLFLQERSVDPRHLVAAAILAARHRGVHFSSGDRVLAVALSSDNLTERKVTGVRTNKTQFASGMVLNCAGAWAREIAFGADTSSEQVRVGTGGLARPSRPEGSGVLTPTRPVKGQMLCVAMPQKETVRHVIRTPNVYLIPRTDGRLLIGATQEEAGFDKQTVPETLQKLRQAAIRLVPALTDARILEAWAGLRPGTPDNLPILGATSIPGYFVATGHFRDGILLAPVTAVVMRQAIAGQNPGFDLTAMSPQRFMPKC